jgi:hypothetical protein
MVPHGDCLYLCFDLSYATAHQPDQTGSSHYRRGPEGIIRFSHFLEQAACVAGTVIATTVPRVAHEAQYLRTILFQYRFIHHRPLHRVPRQNHLDQSLRPSSLVLDVLGALRGPRGNQEPAQGHPYAGGRAVNESCARNHRG